MSIETWKQEHYPVEAKEAAGDDLTAARHSFAKWQGLTPEALAKHGLTAPPIPMNGETCALCVRHYKGHERCGACPIQRKTQGCYVYSGALRPKLLPYGEWTEKRNPAPMVKVLRDCVARLEAKQGGKR